MRLDSNNWFGDYEDEIWYLPTQEQLAYWSMRDVEQLADDATNRGFPKTLKFLAVHKGQSNIFLKKQASAIELQLPRATTKVGDMKLDLSGIRKESSITQQTILTKLSKSQSLLMYKMLATLAIQNSENTMYRKYKDRVDLGNAHVDDEIGEPFRYALEVGSYCIRGSDEKVIKDYWFNKIGKSLTLKEIISIFLSRKDNKVRPIVGVTQESVNETNLTRNSDISNQTIPLLDEKEIKTFDWYMTLKMNYLTDNHFPVVSFTLPFEYMSSYEFLKAYIDIADRANNIDLFANENIKVAVIAAWEDYGRFYHIILCLIYMLFLALLSYSNYAYQSQIECLGISIVILLLTILLFLIELNQTYMFGFLDYITDYQNILEISGLVLVFFGTAMRIKEEQDTTTTEQLMAWALVLVYLSSLNLLRPFKYTGPLIQMIYAVTIRITPFFLILMIVIFGFSQAFYLLANDIDVNFLTMQDSYLYSYVYISGGAQYNPTGDDKSNSMVLLEAIYVAFAQILLLNLLVAFLSYIYTGIQEKSDAAGTYEQCRIIVGQVRPFGAPMGQRWIHFLKNETDVENDKLTSINKESTNQILKTELNKLNGDFHLLDNKINTIDYTLKKDYYLLESQMKNLASNIENNHNELNGKIESNQKELKDRIEKILNAINAKKYI